MKNLNRNALKRGFFAAFARLVGVALGAAAGSWVQRMGGDTISSWWIAGGMFFVSFLLMWFSEYERVN